MGYDEPVRESVKERLDRELGSKSTPAERTAKRVAECYAAVAQTVRAARAVARRSAECSVLGRDLLVFIESRSKFAEAHRADLRHYLRARREARPLI